MEKLEVKARNDQYDIPDFDLFLGDDWIARCIDKEKAKEHADQIAKCWNSHDDLLEICQEMHEMLKDIPDWPDLEHESRLNDKVEKIIKKATK